MELDGFISGREIVDNIRAQLSHLSLEDRATFARQQVRALAQCPDDLMRVAPASILPVWRALEAAFRIDHAAGLVGTIASRQASLRLLIAAADLFGDAARLIDEAGARLMADVMVPQAVAECMLGSEAW